MWAGIWITLFAFASVMTLLYLFERSVVFSSAFAGASWLFLGLTPQVIVASEGSQVAFTVGGIRYLLIGLSMLSFVVLTLDLFGSYRTEPDLNEVEI